MSAETQKSVQRKERGSKIKDLMDNGKYEKTIT